MLRPEELIVDNFAGGGGASNGIEAALRRPIDIAINHDPEAIAMHMANHPHTRHLCEDVWNVDPVAVCEGRPVGLAWFSPDCKHFSKAKGGKPVSKNIRGLAWVAIRWAELKRPRIILLENVEEFQHWSPLLPNDMPDPDRKGQTFQRWVGRLRNQGYSKIEWRELRACDYGTPTIRKRLVVVARCDGEGIWWPDKTHGGQDLLPYRTAAECIDWDRPCPSIFLSREEGRAIGVNRPLAEATMRRIARGVKRYVIDAAEPFIVPIAHYNGSNTVQPIREPLRTITANPKGGSHAIVIPSIATYYGSNREGDDRVASLQEPLRTQSTENRFGLISAFLAQHNTGRVGHAAEEPLSTITQRGTNQSVVTAFLSRQFGKSTGSALDEPVGTVTARGKSALVTSNIVKLLERPGLTRLRDLVHAGAVDVILALDTDRLSRELEHLLLLGREIEKRGRLEFVTATYEDSPTGKLFFQIKGAFSQYERAVIRERTMRGRREKVKQGLYVGGVVAYGYVCKQSHLEPVEPQAKTVRQIFDWYLSGVAIRAIVRRLQESGVQPCYGGLWGKSSVRHILENETYAGTAHWNKYRKLGTILRLKPLSERIPMTVPALVPRERWEHAQILLSEKQQAGRTSTAYLLRGIFYCSCGRRMHGDPGKRRFRTYRCSARDRDGQRVIPGTYCRTSASVAKVDAAVWAALLGAFCDGDELRLVLERERKKLQDLGQPEQQIEFLSKQVIRLRAKEQRCLSLMLDADMAEDLPALKGKHAECKRERLAAEARIAALEAGTRQLVATEEWLDSTVGLLREYLPSIEDAAKKQQVIRELIARAEWDAEAQHVKLSCFFGAQMGQTSSHCALLVSPLPSFRFNLIAKVAA